MAGFLNGAVAMACLAIGVFFARFWRESNDRLFLCVAVGFGAFAVNYAALGIVPFAHNQRVYAFVLRLVGFVAILIGVLLKNGELVEDPPSKNLEQQAPFVHPFGR
jgi:hypothetical protein